MVSSKKLAIYSLCTFGAIGFSVPAYSEDDFFDLSIMELVEVVVSVQKRDVLLQNAPASVLVIDSESIERFHINQTFEVINHVPGFTINADNLTEPNLFMRGVGTDIESAASNSAIGFFMDDVYLSRSMAYAMDIFDIQRVEILRGPQGTLYGKNVVGGVVNFVSNKPTVENTAIVQALAGSYNTLEMNGVASGQLSDSMLGRIAFTSRSHDGYAKNTYTGNDMDDLSSSGFRAQLGSNPVDELDVMVTVDKHRRSNAGKWIDMKIPSENNLPFKNSDPRKGPNNIDGKQNADIAGFGLHIFWTGKNWALSAISAFRQSEIRSLNNEAGSYIDFSLIPWDHTIGRVDFTHPDYDPSLFNDDLFISDKSEDLDTFSQEFNFSTDNETALNYMLGAFFMLEKIERYEGHEYLFGQYYTQGFESANTESDNRTIGVFSEVSYGFNDSLTAVLGVRYTHDDKDFSVYRYNEGDFLGADFVDSAGNPVKSFYAKDEHSWDAITPSLSLSWMVSNDMLLYALGSKGFKSGGWNGENASSPEEAITRYDEEFAINYEVGFKSWLLDRRLSLNGTLFHTVYEDLQTQQFVSFAEGMTPDNVIANAGEATVHGLELELSALIAPWWLLNFNYAYMNSEISSDLISTELRYNPECDCSQPFDTNLKGNDLRRSPENSFTLDNVWSFPVSEVGTFSIALNYSWNDNYYLDNKNSKRTEIESYEIVDLSVSLLSLDSRWEISLWGKNITDKLYEESVTDVIDTVLVSYGPPKTAGIAIKWQLQ